MEVLVAFVILVALLLIRIPVPFCFGGYYLDGIDLRIQPRNAAADGLFKTVRRGALAIPVHYGRRYHGKGPDRRGSR